MPNILGLGGLFFKAKDPKALAEWYQKWLGMELAHPYGLTFQADSIPANGYQVWTPFKEDTTYFEPVDKPFMFNFMVDDLEGMLAQIKPSGCTIIDDVEQGEYGDFAWFIDPEGNKVELWQPPSEPPSC